MGAKADASPLARVSGRAFSAETALAPPVRRWLERTGSSCVAEEVVTGAGIVDLIGGVGSRRRLRTGFELRPDSPTVDTSRYLSTVNPRGPLPNWRSSTRGAFRGSKSACLTDSSQVAWSREVATPIGPGDT